MRRDRGYPWQVYEGFADWLRRHPLWIINVLLGYAYYLATTEEM